MSLNIRKLTIHDHLDSHETPVDTIDAAKSIVLKVKSAWENEPIREPWDAVFVDEALGATFDFNFDTNEFDRR